MLFVPYKICNKTSATVASLLYVMPKLRSAKNQNAKRIAEKPMYGMIKVRNFFWSSSRNGAFAERSKVQPERKMNVGMAHAEIASYT